MSLNYTKLDLSNDEIESSDENDIKLFPLQK